MSTIDLEENVVAEAFFNGDDPTNGSILLQVARATVGKHMAGLDLGLDVMPTVVKVAPTLTVVHPSPDECYSECVPDYKPCHGRLLTPRHQPVITHATNGARLDGKLDEDVPWKSYYHACPFSGPTPTVVPSHEVDTTQSKTGTFPVVTGKWDPVSGRCAYTLEYHPYPVQMKLVTVVRAS